MRFSDIIKKRSPLLLPFSWLYYTGVVLHNKLYEWGFKKTSTYTTPLICVGNLSVGGTGKTPMVEYLLRLLHHQYRVATVSRGYKRKTTGLIEAVVSTTAQDIGDEPMQFHINFPDALVLVDEVRNRAVVHAIDQKADIVILDDALQHRAISAGLNILLTDYSNLFVTDYYLPAGQLRDLKANYKNVQAIVVTKCPADLPAGEKENIIAAIRPVNGQQVFFATLTYGALQHILTKSVIDIGTAKQVLLVTGIANPAPLVQYISSYNVILHTMIFDDHHDFSDSDVKSVLDKYRQSNDIIIITTEKDAVKLQAFTALLNDVNIYSIPIMHQFLFNEAEAFDNIVKNYITTNLANTLNF